MSPREDILSTLQRRAQELRRLGVRRLGLFGSVARGEDHPGSDLDFVVEFDKKSFDSFMELKFLLEDTFHRRVDLVLADGIKPLLREHIHGGTVHVPGF
jgi:predicted nucleotidyltransferase